MPVNIDSQAQLADDVLTSPRPDMFKTQQLQVPDRPDFWTGCSCPDILGFLTGHLGLFTKRPRAVCRQINTNWHTPTHNSTHVVRRRVVCRICKLSARAR